MGRGRAFTVEPLRGAILFYFAYAARGRDVRNLTLSVTACAVPAPRSPIWRGKAFNEGAMRLQLPLHHARFFDRPTRLGLRATRLPRAVLSARLQRACYTIIKLL